MGVDGGRWTGEHETPECASRGPESHKHHQLAHEKKVVGRSSPKILASSTLKHAESGSHIHHKNSYGPASGLDIHESDELLLQEVLDVNMPLDQVNQKNRGFGFVEFELQEDAAAAIENMNGSELFGVCLCLYLPSSLPFFLFS